MQSAVKLYRALLAIVLSLLFFNALLDRLASYYLSIRPFTLAFYVILTGAILYQLILTLRTGNTKVTQGAALCWLMFIICLGALYGDVTASVVAIKQFFLGIVLLFVFGAQPLPIGVLIADLVLVLGYALFQGLYFVTQSFQLPPWDAVYIRERLESGAALNWYQGDLIRPFATFASFSEYQIVVHAFVTTLFLLRSRLAHGHRRIATGLLMLLAIQDVILTDRTPILMSLIIVLVSTVGSALFRGLLTGSRQLIGGAAMALVTVAGFWLASDAMTSSQNPGVRRLGESAQFWRAETVREREAHQWTSASQSIAWYPEGMGPNEVTIDYNSAAQRPHNNFFLLQIGYSYALPFLFVAFIALIFAPVFGAVLSPSGQEAQVGFCGFGLTLAYVAASAFNVPFTGYAGVAFFLLMHWLRSELLKSQGARRLVSVG